MEEEIAPLAPISGDKPVVVSEEGELPAWTFRLCFTQGMTSTVAVATSHRWPGASSLAVQKADKFASVYFGYGIEYTGHSFTPQAPPPIVMEVGDPDEFPEVVLSVENELLKVRLNLVSLRLSPENTKRGPLILFRPSTRRRLWRATRTLRRSR